MPYKTRKRRRNFGDFDLDALRKQSFPEWWALLCGHWQREFRTISNREAMLAWYLENKQAFDCLHPQPSIEPGHRPGERHSGWWFSIGFLEHGPRLIANPEQVEQRIGRILSGHWLPSESFHKQSDQLIKNWIAGRMLTETELRDHVSLCVPARNFPDGFETSREFLERCKLLTADEESILFEENLKCNMQE
jgi:hypothetical protein